MGLGENQDLAHLVFLLLSLEIFLDLEYESLNISICSLYDFHIAVIAYFLFSIFSVRFFKNNLLFTKVTISSGLYFSVTLFGHNL